MLNPYELANKIDQYRKFLVQFAEGKVLETAVGTSRNIKYYNPTCDVVGIDWAKQMVEVSVLKQAPLLNVDYKIGESEQLPFPDDSFDSVVETFGMESYLDPTKVLSEMKRVCKKDGRILLMTSGYSHYDLINLYMEYKSYYYVCKHGYFPTRKWDEIITDKDFEIELAQRKLNGSLYIYILKNSKK